MPDQHYTLITEVTIEDIADDATDDEVQDALQAFADVPSYVEDIREKRRDATIPQSNHKSLRYRWLYLWSERDNVSIAWKETNMEALQETLVATLAHSHKAMTVDEFVAHPAISARRCDIEVALERLVEQGIFRTDITTYPPQDGETVYMFVDNDVSQEAFNKAIAEG